MRVLRLITAAALILSVAPLVYSQVPVTGGGGAGLGAIAGTDTLVTVVLKRGGAKDANLKIVKVDTGLLTVRTQSGIETTYRLADVQEIQVQGAVMKTRQIDVMRDVGMTTDQQEIVTRALARTSEIFNAGAANQSIRMAAAEILAVGGAASATSDDSHGGTVLAREQAVEYLTALAKGNDLRTAIAASLHLSYAGQKLPSETIVQDGLASGDRTVKAAAARLAGISGDTASIAELRIMLEDRVANISAPAARALANLGDKEVVPTLIAMVTERNVDKANAAALGLIELGDKETINLLRAKLKDTEGLSKFRVAAVMYELGDTEAGGLLRDEFMNVPSIRFDAACTLAKKGDAKAMQFLRDWLQTENDPTELNFTQRALATHALIKAGDRTNAGVLQGVLREASPAIQVLTLRLIADLDVEGLLPMVLPALTGNEPMTVMTSCQTAVSMAHNDYGDRLRKYLD
ncbi:MAG: HEAT repeat domain-containing protein [Candidatus Hydrogenedentes bacterium]|nr:HEAT repeat domain-containing protein [Candidatus Hydrogenedentota bacterium]